MTIRNWLDEMSSGDSNEVLLGLARHHLSRVRSSLYAGHIADLIDQRDFRGLSGLDLEYRSLSAQDAYELRQIRAFFEKRDDLELGVDREEVAWNSFKEAEDLCKETNAILKAVRQNLFTMDSDFDAAIFAARRKIALLLGDVPRLSDLRPRFGPGASTKVTKRMASWKRKLSEVPACSEDLLPLARLCLEEMQGWFLSHDGPDSVQVDLEIHPGKLAFVPKSFKTFRSIVVEPQLNSMFQLGIGSYIGRRLRRVGVDIRDQTKNKSLAQLGSLTGDLATLDLSSASDTVALELIAELLPVDWFSFLKYFRTGKVQYKGEVIKLEKFSSMGNGFTFPLETLVFWALARSVVDAHPEGGEDATVSVYGDDIIVPTRCTEAVSRVLRLAGFKVNTEKSYSDGPFRESCGGDYLSGTDIRPFYQRNRISGQTLFALHNFYVRRWDEESAALVLATIPPHMMLWGPDGYGDGHLLKRDCPLTPHGRSKGWGGYCFETYTLRPRTDYSVLPGDRVLPMYSTYVCENGLTIEQEERLRFRKELDKLCDQDGWVERQQALALHLDIKSRLAGVSHDMPDQRDTPVTKHGREQQPLGSLPGFSKVNRIKVYVLA
jgi:hypothetical protein